MQLFAINYTGMLEVGEGLNAVLGGRELLNFNSAEDEAAAMDDYQYPNISSDPNPAEEDDSAEVFGDEDGDLPVYGNLLLCMPVQSELERVMG